MEQQLKIFIVDDDPIYLKSLENSLKETSYYKSEIHTFLSGEECIKSLSIKPDIVILDYYLDGKETNQNHLDGIKTLIKIKNTSPKTKVIMLSGQENPEIAAKSIKNGALEYFMKNDAAFVKIKNIIKNMVNKKESILNIEKKIPLSRTINIILIIILILLFLLSRFL